MKNIIIVLLLVSSINVFAQNSKEYDEAVQKVNQMLQSGNMDPNELKKIWDNIKVEESPYSKITKELNKQNATSYFNSAQQKANNHNYAGAIYDYDVAINYSPTSEIYNAKGCSQYSLGEYKNALESFNKALELDVENEKIIQNKIFAQQQVLKVENAPISIYDIKIANTDQKGNVLTDYGLPIYSDNTCYLKPKIYYRSNVNITVSLNVKFIQPDGSLRTGDNSPKGYSIKSDITVNGNGSKSLAGWGSTTKGNWSSGKYRIEIWYDNVCLAFTSLDISQGNNNCNIIVMPPPNYIPIQDNTNSKSLTLKRKVCPSCNGTKVCSSPSYGVSFGLDRSSNTQCPVCGKFENHRHDNCSQCQGKGYIESYEY